MACMPKKWATRRSPLIGRPVDERQAGAAVGRADGVGVVADDQRALEAGEQEHRHAETNAPEVAGAAAAACRGG